MLNATTMEISPYDRRILDALKSAIADPNTPKEKRAELREELGEIATSCVIGNLVEYDGDAEDAPNLEVEGGPAPGDQQTPEQ